MYLGMTIHAKTRKKNIIELLTSLGFSIPKTRVLELLTAMGIEVLLELKKIKSSFTAFTLQKHAYNSGNEQH